MVMEMLERAAPELKESLAKEAMEKVLGREEIEEFLALGTSSSRPMKFDCMQIPPSKRFNLHAHPNLELVLCIRGRLHEWRMVGGSWGGKKDWTEEQPRGPDLGEERTAWELRTLNEGEWLVNEAGSVHLSFTDEAVGCTLFVLWSGKHANVEEGGWPTDFELDSEKLCLFLGDALLSKILTMSRLNDTIKFGVLIVNSVLLLLSLVTILVGALVLTGNWSDFDPDTFETTALWACVIGGVLLILTLVGCFGAVTQTEREGTCTGRRLLSTYQVFLIILLVLFVRLGIEGKTTIDSMEWTLDNRGQGEYDKGDNLLANKDLCETAMARWKEDNVYDADAMALCPYHVCRYQILAEVVDTVDPILDVIAISIYIIGAMIFLTCLLICYNPHDDTAAQLIKTGVLVEKRGGASSGRRASSPRQPQQQQRRQTRGGSAASRKGPTGPSRGHQKGGRGAPPRGHKGSNAAGHNRL
ncbi:hypothetical protein TrRE_jg12274 [Triparma retinervis]|uniref:Uncharacterized protein n=1 Tax=Triparma retinervis TaxID=2557542 RepID=A0A9W7ACD9_9STRA|nr:hypothetical protein TrRE_jg12274 [Triparma retinervis]